MYHFDSPATLVGVSELRTHLDEILSLARKTRVYLAKRQKPVAVLVAIEKFREMEELLDRLEDAALGHEALRRDRRAKTKDYLSLDEAERRVGQ